MESGAFDLNVRSDVRRRAALPRIPLALHPNYKCESPAGARLGFTRQSACLKLRLFGAKDVDLIRSAKVISAARMCEQGAIINEHCAEWIDV